MLCCGKRRDMIISFVLTTWMVYGGHGWYMVDGSQVAKLVSICQVVKRYIFAVICTILLDMYNEIGFVSCHITEKNRFGRTI